MATPSMRVQLIAKTASEIMAGIDAWAAQLAQIKACCVAGGVYPGATLNDRVTAYLTAGMPEQEVIPPMTGNPLTAADYLTLVNMADDLQAIFTAAKARIVQEARDRVRI
jgi:hypothetical protein